MKIEQISVGQRVRLKRIISSGKKRFETLTVDRLNLKEGKVMMLSSGENYYDDFAGLGRFNVVVCAKAADVVRLSRKRRGGKS